MLFRLGNPGASPEGDGNRSMGGHVTHMHANADLELTVAPIMVGNPNWGPPSVDSGYQPKAAVVAGDRILWNERRDAFNFSGNPSPHASAPHPAPPTTDPTPTTTSCRWPSTETKS